MSTDELHKCACCEEPTVGFFCRACETASCCMINGAKCGRF